MVGLNDMSLTRRMGNRLVSLAQAYRALAKSQDENVEADSIQPRL